MHCCYLHCFKQGKCLSDLVHLHQRNKWLSMEEDFSAFFFKKVGIKLLL